MVGTGGYSVVKMAQNRYNEEVVAIKIVKKNELSKKQYKAILKEVSILERLDNERILGFRECYNDDTYICIVTEWLSMDTYDYINFYYDSITEMDVKNLFRMTVESIQYCHQNRLMHRDIKPENILLSVGEKGEILGLRLADFGMVCEFDSQKINDEFGTCGYQAPEVVCNVKYNEKIDSWSLGVLLFNLITGKMPFAAKYLNKINERVVHEEPAFKDKAWK